MRSLADEWQSDYPHLMNFTEILKRRKAVFTVDDITAEECEDLCLTVASEVFERNDDLTTASRQVVEGLQNGDIPKSSGWPRQFKRRASFHL
jgi:hypothetical protein